MKMGKIARQKNTLILCGQSSGRAGLTMPKEIFLNIVNVWRKQAAKQAQKNSAKSILKSSDIKV